MKNRVLFLVIAFLLSGAAKADGASYTYDALGRLTQVSYGAATAAVNVIYSYDATGNRTSVVTTGAIQNDTGTDFAFPIWLIMSLLMDE